MISILSGLSSTLPKALGPLATRFVEFNKKPYSIYFFSTRPSLGEAPHLSSQAAKTSSIGKQVLPAEHRPERSTNSMDPLSYMIRYDGGASSDDVSSDHLLLYNLLRENDTHRSTKLQNTEKCSHNVGSTSTIDPR